MSRVVKHLTAGSKGLVITDDNNIDIPTRRWLEHTYSTRVFELPTKISLPNAEESPSFTSLSRLPRVDSQQQRVVDFNVLNSWQFDTLQYSNDELITIANYI